MRRSRRGGHAGMEFGGSGEDSFVAVVVTKLTGALLFILLLTMVIMALLPKAIDQASGPQQAASEGTAAPLEIATPGALPEAIAGRPYHVAMAARGGDGPLQWSIAGELPEGLAFEPETGQLEGTPKAGTPEPLDLVVRVSDGRSQASRPVTLAIYKPDGPLSLPSRWAPGLPPIPWQLWLQQGFGFLILFLLHLVGMSTVSSVQRWSSSRILDPTEADARRLRRRFLIYRMGIRLTTLAATTTLVVWLWRQQGRS